LNRNWLFGVAVLSVAALTLISNNGWSQQGGPGGVQRLHARHQENPAPPSPAIDSTSSLGQAMVSCDKDTAIQDSFALPGLKSDVTLDRCYKGRAHLVCVFDALIAEAKSLTDSYTKIVDAKYPEFNSVDNICKMKPDTLASDIAGSEDFTKRFAILKAKYESASKCALTVKQAFRDVVLSDMTQAPEVLNSMAASMEADINRISEVENQTADLATKMEAAKKAMKTIEKIHRSMCVKEKTSS